MKLILLSTLLTTTMAFAPAPLPTSRATTAHHLSAVSALPKVSLPKLSNPYKSLPWVVSREEHRAKRDFEYGNAAMFRELGLPYNAHYEDIKARTDILIAQYANDVKKRIQVEVARDKIYMLRLNQRMDQLNKDDLAASKKENAKAAVRKGKKPMRIPLISGLVDFAHEVYMPPDEAWMKRQYIIWGLSTLFCLINPPMVENFARVNWLAAGGMMGYRGMPGMEDREPGSNPFRGRRNKAHQVQAMGVALAIWVVAKAVAEGVVMRVPVMVASRSCEWFKFAIVQGVLCLSCLFVQTYQGEGGRDLMI
jgi:hypothetical protein